MKVCFASIDIEPDFAKEGNFKGVENLRQVLDIFEKNNISATLFVTGEVLEKYIDKLKEWSENYEIACHSFSHKFWDELSLQERKGEIERFAELYRKIFNQSPKGFRAPSHIIDEQGLQLLQNEGFLYDSSVVPHYPFFKKYRGYKRKAPQIPYFPDFKDCRKGGKMEILEIPVTGIFSVPLAGTWISKLPLIFYKFLFRISNPVFLTLNLHSWDSLDSKLLEKIEEILKILREEKYKFLSGIEIYELFSKN